MRKTFGFVAFVCVLGLLVPALMTNEWGRYLHDMGREGLTMAKETGTYDQMQIRVYLHETQEIREMSLEEYLTAVVAAEMPATFHEEALKAQAVAARSYTLNKMAAQGYDEEQPPHYGADICTDIYHCKAFTTKEQARNNWGEARFLEYWEKIENAVYLTDGEVVCFEEEPISAVFHSTSPGRTEDAKNIWGNEVAYLKGVDSPGDANSPQYNSVLRISSADFRERVEAMAGPLNWQENPKEWVGTLQPSQSGTVLEIVIADQRFTGVQMREAFNLRSAAFNLHYEEGEFIFSVTGYGHGVGMSQYGAQYMAVQGAPYAEILKWYYTGTTIKNMNQQE